MKVYKLIKWYPSLPTNWEEGMEVGTGDRKDGTYSPCNSKYENGRIVLLTNHEVEGNPEYWEEVMVEIERIVVFDTYSRTYYVKNPKGKFRSHGKTLTKKPVDTIEYTIAPHEINDKDARYIHIVESEDCERPLFISEDGVGMYVDDKAFSVDRERLKICSNGKSTYTVDFTPNPKYAYLSTLKACYNFILMNKTNLSLNDVFTIYPQFKKNEEGVLTKHAEELINLSARKW